MLSLYHGPSSRETALKETPGKLIGTIGDDGLKVDAVRDLLDLIETNPIGDDPGIVLVGPLDEGSSESLNALLKTLEEGTGEHIQLLLWALDLSAVLPTIRSRCGNIQWCPGDSNVTAEAPFLGVAEKLCEAALKKRVGSVVSLWAEQTGKEEQILRASAEVLWKKEDWPLDARLSLWKKLRKVQGCSSFTMLSAYLGRVA